MDIKALGDGLRAVRPRKNTLEERQWLKDTLVVAQALDAAGLIEQQQFTKYLDGIAGIRGGKVTSKTFTPKREALNKLWEGATDGSKANSST